MKVKTLSALLATALLNIAIGPALADEPVRAGIRGTVAVGCAQLGQASGGTVVAVDVLRLARYGIEQAYIYGKAVAPAVDTGPAYAGEMDYEIVPALSDTDYQFWAGVIFAGADNEVQNFLTTFSKVRPEKVPTIEPFTLESISNLEYWRRGCAALAANLKR